MHFILFFLYKHRKSVIRGLLTFIISVCLLSAFSQKKLLTNSHLRHVVLPHETFNDIGRLYGLTGEQVADYNNLEFYEDDVLAKYLAIPLQRGNFSYKNKVAGGEILVPVFRINGSRERVVLFKATDRPHINLSIAKRLLPDGFLHTSKTNEPIFRTVSPAAVAKVSLVTKKDPAIHHLKDTGVVHALTARSAGNANLTSKEASLVPAFAERRGDTASTVQMAPVLIKNTDVLKASVKKIKPPIVITNTRIPRPMLRVDKVFFLVKAQVAITVLLVMLIFLYMLVRNKKDVFKSELKGSIRALLIDQILQEEDLVVSQDASELINTTLKKRLQVKANRQFLIDEITNGRKNVKGRASDRLLELYLKLHLEEDSASKLKSKNWNDVAKGIQELSILQQRHYMSDIFNQINSKNEHVRMEAQSALLQLSGFGGLWFLNVLNYPISDWQQMRLISMLSASPLSDIPDLHLLLTSTNDSLVIFTLKLIGVFQQRTMHNDVVKCLENKSEKVRFTAIKCLEQINSQYTADILIKRFGNETRKNKIAIVTAVGELGNNGHIKFLLKVLSLKDDTLKITAAKALTRLGTEGQELLEEYCSTKGYPYSQIFLHLKPAV